MMNEVRNGSVTAHDLSFQSAIKKTGRYLISQSFTLNLIHISMNRAVNMGNMSTTYLPPGH